MLPPCVLLPQDPSLLLPPISSPLHANFSSSPSHFHFPPPLPTTAIAPGCWGEGVGGTLDLLCPAPAELCVEQRTVAAVEVDRFPLLAQSPWCSPLTQEWAQEVGAYLDGVGLALKLLGHPETAALMVVGRG